MSDVTKKRQWVPSPSGPNEVYINNIEASWSLFDVRLALGQLRPDGLNGSDFVIEERVGVTASWAVIKNIATQLNALVTEYERLNEVIPLLKLVGEKEEQ